MPGIDTFKNNKSEMVDHIQKKNALTDMKNNISGTYVWPYQGEIAGFVSISMYFLNRSLLKRSQMNKMRFSEIPVILLGQIATHTDFQRQKLGREMVIWTLAQATKYSKKLGCRGVVLHCYPCLVNWYRDKCQFVHLNNTSEKGVRKNVMFFDILERT
ncbi:MAG: GNAT family N-acetyltransferase [Nitrosopumilus sp.]|nr:GNAT family N-acetyltransferase [Nitrosopumilus sp.]